VREKICVVCSAPFETATSAIYCGDDCREERRREILGSPESRHVVLCRQLEAERVPRTDLLWSLRFYQGLLEGCDNRCFYCEGPLSISGHSLDRIENLKGHRCWNVVPACSMCNSIKSDILSFSEMLELRDDLVRIAQRRALETKS
jgi:hypothetical protein